MSVLWVTSIFCPLLGLLLALIMWFTPLLAIMKARESESLGTLNSLTYPPIVWNCIGWTMYGVMRGDYYIFLANAPGIVLGSFFTMVALQLLIITKNEESKRMGRILEVALIGAVIFWLLVALIAGICLKSHPSIAEKIVGTLSCIFAICFYGAPLSTMFEILKTGDTSSLYIPSICTNATCSTMWFLYGIQDINVWLPNGLGLLLCVSQMTLVVVFWVSGTRAGNATPGSYEAQPEGKDVEDGSGVDLPVVGQFPGCRPEGSSTGSEPAAAAAAESKEFSATNE